MVCRVQLSPFFERRRVLGVETFEAEIQVGQCGWKAVLECVAGRDVGTSFGFVVGTMEFSESRKGGG